MEIISPHSGDLYEGPIWHPEEKALYWINILAGTIHRLDFNKQLYLEIKLKEYVSAISPKVSGGLVAASGKGIYSVSLDGTVKEIYVVKDWDPRNRFNDGKCDALGRFWIGTMNLEEKDPTGAFYVLDTNLKFTKVLDNITISNGLAWNSDNTKLYYIDSPTKKIFWFDFDLDKGKIDNKNVVIDLSNQKGVPDGMTIDSKGNLWVAFFGGGKVLNIDPNAGEIIDSIEVPTPNVTSVTFGGENLSTLYITTAKIHLENPDKNAGYVYAEKLGVRGTKVNFCGF